MDFLKSFAAVTEATEAQFKLARLRSEQLYNFYSAERRAGACPLVANERMAEFAKRLDALDEQRTRESADATS